jgi:hypothetical protein
MAAKLKIEKRGDEILIVHCCFSVSQNELSSNLGTFWLKIEQFWPFEEISIFSNGSHLGYRTVLTDTILKGDHLRIKMATVTKNRNLFKWPKLISFKPECAQILTV